MNLEESFKNKLRKNEVMASHTTFKIGGPAKYFLEVESSEELVEAVKIAKSENLEYALIGGGSNLLVSDSGFKGLVIKMKNDKCQVINDKLVAGAGSSLKRLLNLAGENELSGLEWVAGVPGTVGGAVVMNAGCFGGEMKDVVVKVKYLDSHACGSDNGDTQILSNKDPNNSNNWIKELSNKQCQFSYRESVFQKHPEWIVLEAELKLEKGKKEEIKNKTQEYLARRSKNIPSEPSAGSIFKKHEIKPEEKLQDRLVKTLEKEHPEFLQGNYIPAGWLIEEAGLKGRVIGKARVSLKHANFIINLGGATAENVMILIAIIKEKIRNEFGIQLQEEVQYLGF